MEFNYLDIIVSIIILFLGLKGIINGFFKELFGLIGIIGGIFIASRVGDKVGQIISDIIFKFESNAVISFTGFLVTFALFWLFMISVGLIFKKLSSLSGFGIFDKILGFLFSASKFFLIASVIAYATNNIKAMKTSIDSTMHNSFMFPLLVKSGSVIMKLDPAEVSQDMNATINKSTEAVKDSVNDTLQNSTLKIIEDTKSILSDDKKQNLSNKEKK